MNAASPPRAWRRASALLWALAAACSAPAGTDGDEPLDPATPALVDNANTGMGVPAPVAPAPVDGADAGTGVPAPVPPQQRPRPAQITSVELSPATVELEAVGGDRPEQRFEVVATYSDGHTRSLTTGEFTVDRPEIGEIGGAFGRFVASGVAGGEATVTFEVVEEGKGWTAEATVTVTLVHTLDAPDLPADAEERLAQPPVRDPARAANVVYPLEGALMPQNVFPADVQWLEGHTGDLFEITLDKPHARVRTRLVHTGFGFGNHYLVDRDAWRALAQTDPADPVALRVRRYDSAAEELIESAEPRHFSFAQAALTGSVYYWDIQAGRIVRIDDGTDQRVSFMPTPPLGCIGCHAVSPSGRYMAGRLGGGENFGTVFDLTTDLTGQPPPTVFPTDRTKWWFSAWSPDETRLVVSRGRGDGPSLGFLDPLTGMDVPVTGALPTNASQPDWAPDGSAIAYIKGASQWGNHAVKGDLAILPITGPDTVGPLVTLHRGADLAMSVPAGVADSYPSWSPDSKTITFTHGDGARSDTHRGALYLINRDGSDVRRLDNASGGPDTTDSYQSRFSPFETDDYFWISFLSRRDYGNALAGTRGTQRQQIWVAAIRRDAPAGEDPSEVAYWLPGQDTASKNISAYWAPRACREDGQTCSVGSECCGGDCRPDEAGALVCSPPPPEQCRQLGQTCGSADDCCDPAAECIRHVCELPVILL